MIVWMMIVWMDDGVDAWCDAWGWMGDSVDG